MKNPSQRIVGFDFLRIILAIQVITTHLAQALIPSATDAGLVWHSEGLWTLIVIGTPSVGLFVLTTGYLSVSSRYKVSRIIPLWLMTAFYSVAITLAYMLFHPLLSFNLPQLVLSFLPVTTEVYWYFTCYFAFFFCMPFLNQYLLAISKRRFLSLLLVMFVLFSVIQTLALRDLFQLGFGHSVIWMAFLHMLGAFLRLHGKELGLFIKKRWCALFHIITLIIIVLSKPFFIALGAPGSGTLLVRLTSPFFHVAALFQFLFLIQLNIKNRFVLKCIPFLSVTSFSAYLIGTSPYFILNLESMSDAFFNIFANLSPLALIVGLPLLAFILFIVFALIEHLRLLLFRLVRLDRLPQKLDAFLASPAKARMEERIIHVCKKMLVSFSMPFSAALRGGKSEEAAAQEPPSENQ